VSKKKVSKKGTLKSYIHSYNFTGVLTGMLFVYLSFGPSLLPRAWFMQAVISAVLFVFGYGIGVFISYIVRQFTFTEPSADAKRKIKTVAVVVFALAYVIASWLGYIWQQNSHQLMNIDTPASYSMIGIFALTAVLIAVLIWIIRITRTFFRWLRRQINRLLPQKIANVLAIAVTVFVIVGIADGFLLQGAYSFVSNMFSVKNSTTPQGIERQNVPNVSGSDESLISWDSLGLQGRKFIGNVTTKDELEAFNKTVPQAPIRIYSGLESASDVNERAELAAADLVRAGGFNRDVVVVVTTTGTGWVDEQGVDPIEYMYNGNSAIVSMQYSYLPSWISFLVDQQKAKDAGIALYNAVYKEWVKLPVDQRPKLLSYGESLGSFGSEAAFPAVTSMQALSSGAVWVGPPNSNALWSNIVNHRDANTPMILPVYQDGATVRFAGRSGDLQNPGTPWTYPRAVYLQHASDPIVWWSPSLILNKPDWYNETRGYDVNVATRWFPIVTFWQITADMAFANSVPDGHGHKYGTLPVDAWAQVAAPGDWTPQQTQALKDLLGS
jgi:uncharacterized membrane protein